MCLGNTLIFYIHEQELNIKKKEQCMCPEFTPAAYQNVL